MNLTQQRNYAATLHKHFEHFPCLFPIFGKLPRFSPAEAARKEHTINKQYSCVASGGNSLFLAIRMLIFLRSIVYFYF